MVDPFLASFSKVDIHRDYEKFCSKRMDLCILWMWIFCLLQGLFANDIVLPENSLTRRILFASSNSGWIISIVMWFRYFVGSWRAHKRVIKSMDSSIEKIEKFVSKFTPTPPMPSQIASSTSSTMQHGNIANGQI